MSDLYTEVLVKKQQTGNCGCGVQPAERPR